MNTATNWSRAIGDMEAIYTLPGKAPATWQAYRQALDWLKRFAPAPADVGVQTISGILREYAIDRAPATVNKLVRHLEAALGKLCKLGHCARNPFEIDSFRVRDDVDDGADRHHSIIELRRIIDLADAEAADPARPAELDAWNAKRRRALIYTLCLTATRKMEALHVRVADVDLEAGVVWIRDADYRTKTAASRQPVPIPPELVPILEDWIPNTGGVFLFPQRRDRAKPWTGGGKGYKPLDQIKDLGTRAGVAGVTLHSLRHSWATHAELVWGLSELQIQRVMRHTNPRTQRKYRHRDLENLRQIAPRIELRIAPITTPIGEAG